MNPVINLSPAASAVSGSKAVTPQSTGATPGAAPAAGSFETVLAGQETTPGVAENTVQGETLADSGGNARQFSGKDLPGIVAGETGQPPGATTGADLQLPATEVLAGAVTGELEVAGIDALLADGEAVIQAAGADPLTPAVTIEPETNPLAPGWAIYPTTVAGSAAAAAVDIGSAAVAPAVQLETLVANALPGQTAAAAASTAGQVPAAPVAARPEPGQQAAALLQSLAQAGTAATQPAGGEQTLVSASTVAPTVLGLGQKFAADAAGPDSRPLYRSIGAPTLAPVAVDAVQQLETVVAAGAKWRPVAAPGLEQAALQATAAAELFEVATAAEPGQVKVAAPAGHSAGHPAAFGAALAPLETGLLATATRPEAMTYSPGQANWGDEFAGRVSMLIKNGVSEARLQLHPAELGQLEVKISTEGDRAVVMFSAQQAATREAIDAAMPRLREMLEQSGLQLAHSEVSDQSRSPQQDGGSPGELAGDGVAGQPGEDDEALAAGGVAYPLRASDSNSLVDYYA